MSTMLKDIGRYKNRIMSHILSSDDICKALLDKKEVSDDDKDNLIYNQIFPYLYVDETQNDVKSYVCIEVNIPVAPNNTTKRLQIVVWAYSHKKCMNYHKKDYFGTRPDIISDMIERSLCDATDLGIGKIALQTATYFFPTNHYYGRQMVFTTSDFKVKER